MAGMTLFTLVVRLVCPFGDQQDLGGHRGKGLEPDQAGQFQSELKSYSLESHWGLFSPSYLVQDETQTLVQIILMGAAGCLQKNQGPV